MTNSRNLKSVSAAAVAALFLFSAPGALAQCTLSGQPTNFEPNPTGPAAPRPVLLSGGFNYNHALYQNGTSGPWRLLMQESYGYSVLDLTNPASPSVIRWDDLRFDTPPIQAFGDGQSYIQTVAVSPDGQRVALGTFGQTEPNWNTLVGAPGSNNGFSILGDTYPVRSQGTVVHAVQNRYIHYAVTGGGVSVSDITSLSGPPSTLSVPSQVTGWPAGATIRMAGDYLIYSAQDGSIQIVDAARPGPIGAISNGMPRTSLSPADFSGRSISSATGAVDTTGRLWILVELFQATGENSPSYGLVSFTQDGAHNFSSPVSAGPLFRIPSVAGEVWAPSGGASALASMNGSVFVFLWGSRRSSFPYQNILYSTTTGGWPNLTPSVVTNSTFTTLGQMSVLQGTAGSAWGYMSAGLYAWVLPMTCQVLDAPATSAFSVKNTSNANANVSDGDTLPYGEQLAIVPQILPPPIQGQSSDLISWLWHFDYDFHPGNGVEDDPAGTNGRVKNPDSPPAGGQYPPTSVVLWGPCDPKGVPSGNPATGANCWNSVLGNGASGGPDFPDAQVHSTYLALEAINVKGTNGARIFQIKWKVPSLSLQTSQIIAGDPLTAVTDGHPQGTWKWYFGANPGALVLATGPGCTTAACTPTGADAAQGTHHYFFQAPFSQIGYATPDYSGASTDMGTYTISVFSPGFTVQGSATGPVTIGPGQALSVVNSSKHAAGTTGTYSYCIFKSAQACNWTSYSPALSDPPNGQTTTATIPNPGVGTWTLRLKVDWTGGATGSYTTPDITVNATATLTVSAFANPNPANSGDTVTLSCSASGGSGNYAYEWSGLVGGTISTSYSFSQRFTNSSGSDQTNPFFCHVTDTSTLASGDGSVNVTVHPGAPAGAPVASANVSPNPVQIGTAATFSCSATGGTPPYSYEWTSGINSLSHTQSYQYTPTSLGTVPLTCTVTDSASRVGFSVATLYVNPPPGPACNAVDFDVLKGGQVLQPTPGQFGLELPRTAAVGDVLYFSIKQGVSAQFDWSWGDSQPNKTGAISDPSVTFASHTFLSPATYTVTLRGMDVNNAAFCGGTSYQILITGIQVDPNFTPGYADATTFVTTNVMGGKSVRFQASEANADAYAWDFGDGFTGAGKVVTHSFGTGTPTVKLTVTKGATIVSSTLVLTVVAPPDPPRWALGGMAYVTGAGGTFWSSEVAIFNPDASFSQNLKVAFLDGANAVSDESNLTYVPLAPIAPLAGINVKNALAALGRPLGSYGALIVKGEAGQRAIAPVFTTRTFNDQTQAGAGTFGLSVPSAASAGGGVTAQAASAANLLVGLRQNAAARTNLVVVNLNNEWPTVRLDFTDAAGKALGTRIVNMNPYQSVQINNAVQEFADTSDLFTVKASIVDQTGGAKSYAVYPYATVIDQGSTDPIVVSPTSAPASSYRIPGIVRATGANGEKFRSRVTIMNPSANPRRIRLTYSFISCAPGQDCSDRRSYTATLNMVPGQTQSWDDWVKVWFQVKYFAVLDESATYKDALLDVVADDSISDPLVVLGETYNDTPIGHIGLQVPGYGANEGASRTGASTRANTRLVLPGLRFSGDASAGTGFRTNVAVFLTSGSSGGWCTAHVYAPDGTRISDTALEVSPTFQISSSGLGVPADFGNFNVVLDNFDDGITVGAYATIVDNKSGDSTFVKATPVP